MTPPRIPTPSLGRSARGRRVAAAALGLACAALLSCTVGMPPEPPVPGTIARPSVVLFLAENADQSAVAYMPHLRSELTSRGVSFSNAFATTPASSPARVSILTGRYAHGHGVLTDRRSDGGFRQWQRDGGEEPSLAAWLKAARYRTAMVGRYLHEYPLPREPGYVPPGWTHWRGLFFPEPYSGFVLSEDGEARQYAASDYQTDVLREHALAFLDSVPPRQPFFLQLSFAAPRAPSTPAARHTGLFPEIEAPEGPAFDEDVADKPEWLRERPPLAEEELAQLDERFRARVRSLQAVDEAVGGVVRKLRELGRLPMTYLVFTSARGFSYGDHRLVGSVGAAYDASIRVPMVVRGPGVPENSRLGPLVLLLDLAPTVAELCGVEAAPPADGRSLLPLLGPEPDLVQDWRRDFLVEHWDEEEGIPPYAALRSPTHLYVEYAGTARELYALADDPDQLENGAEDADPALLERLAARLAELRECAGASCRTLPPEPEPEKPAQRAAGADAEEAAGADEAEGAEDPDSDLRETDAERDEIG